MRPGQEYWVVRQAGTLNYMPCPVTGYRATWVEFTNDAPPRLFESKRAARRSLTYWCKGRIQGAQSIGYRTVPDKRRYSYHYEILAVRLEQSQMAIGLDPHSIIEHVPSPNIPIDHTPETGVPSSPSTQTTTHRKDDYTNG